MEESQLQALHDAVAKLKPSGRRGLGSNASARYVKGHPVNDKGERKDGLPNNPLYSNFVKEGDMRVDEKLTGLDGDSRMVKKNFDDIVDVFHDDEVPAEKKKRKMTREEKKAAKLAAKKARKMEEKRAAKIAARRVMAETALEVNSTSVHPPTGVVEHRTSQTEHKKSKK
eukprot:CAMPEP_0113320542 /NCGR_PEP_ID=MMETSP0010_2-20120614/14323_1 /TAXON_ID=216773 ORGANISM="Corethron hystrix, Strain 308" /NCGR_SAMPLE_ID=MMETSP0010_2 /ASSEMBLY_ACC=CAM_ASM_000155 /LENGTH=169 /DNA_ID=CAMNT_0000178373 /DNA_START=320 /DNA_END=826 /DNA_ORIENTATION=+ /assembly_acc=CAM_ASM_000155